MTAFKPKWRDWEAKTLPLQTDKADKDPFAGFAGSLPKRIQQNITEKRENSGNTLYQQASKTSKSPKSVVSVKSVSTGTEADWDAETAGIIEWFKATSPPSEHHTPADSPIADKAASELFDFLTFRRFPKAIAG